MKKCSADECEMTENDTEGYIYVCFKSFYEDAVLPFLNPFLFMLMFYDHCAGNAE